MCEGEALGLYGDDIQLARVQPIPIASFIYSGPYDAAHQTFNTPKNGRNRRVDMSQELRAELAELHDRRLDAALLRGTTTIPQVVFCGREDKPLSPSGFYRIHKRICERAGLRANRVHDLRHSYATIQLYEHHTPIQSEQLGHSSINITVNTYGHPRQETSIELADRLDCIGDNVKRYATPAQPGTHVKDVWRFKSTN